MRFIDVTEEEAGLLETWAPLLEFSRRAREAHERTPVHIDDFMLMTRFDTSHGVLTIFKHRESRRELLLDASGSPYRFVAFKTGKPGGRTTRCEIWQAIWGTGLVEHSREVYEYHFRIDDPIYRRRHGEYDEPWIGTPGDEDLCDPWDDYLEEEVRVVSKIDDSPGPEPSASDDGVATATSRVRRTRPRRPPKLRLVR